MKTIIINNFMRNLVKKNLASKANQPKNQENF